MNFSAAAISRKPITTFTLLSQPPDFGNAFIALGKSASKKNGSAKTDANTVMPTSGTNHSPRENETINVPTNGTVQVKLVSENTKPIKMTEVILFWLFAARMFSFESTDDGTPSSNRPKRFSANETKTIATRALTRGLAANLL